MAEKDYQKILAEKIAEGVRAMLEDSALEE